MTFKQITEGTWGYCKRGWEEVLEPDCSKALSLGRARHWEAGRRIMWLKGTFTEKGRADGSERGIGFWGTFLGAVWISQSEPLEAMRVIWRCGRVVIMNLPNLINP